MANDCTDLRYFQLDDDDWYHAVLINHNVAIITLDPVPTIDADDLDRHLLLTPGLRILRVTSANNDAELYCSAGGDEYLPIEPDQANAELTAMGSELPKLIACVAHTLADLWPNTWASELAEQSAEWIIFDDGEEYTC